MLNAKMRYWKRNDPPGFSAVEMIITVGMLGALAAIAIPGILGGIERAGVDGASRLLADDIRLAQSHAISRGGQTRLLVFDSSGVAQVPGGTNITDTSKINSYRIEIRYSPTASWPSINDNVGTNANVLTAWQNLGSLYRGVNVTTSNVLIFSTLGGLVNSTTVLNNVLQGSAGTRTIQTNVIGKATIT
ncbi:MAG TPA: hypothetical protein VLM91_26630 [Candidatus Methylomirabilis sp.]|nr:hypothetical protein [Candidatus Methylomirabilis sp.]